MAGQNDGGVLCSGGTDEGVGRDGESDVCGGGARCYGQFIRIVFAM